MDDETRKLLNKNLEYTKKVHEEILKIKQHIFWQRVFSIIKLVVIIVPLVLAIMVATPFIKEAYETYKEIMGALHDVSKGNPSSLFDGFLN